MLLAQISEKIETIKSTSGSSVGTAERNFNLPILEIPTFNGNILKWQEFWDQFETSIHNNESISNIDRFSYLKRYLTDSTLSTIS